MKDKLFWIALIIGGFILFNKYASTNENAQVEERQGQYPDRGNQDNVQSRNEQTVDAGKYGDLKLPRKNWESKSLENKSAQEKKIEEDLNETRRNTSKKIDAGEYGTLNLPSKNASTTTSSSSVGGSNSSYNSSGATPSSSSERIIQLNPNTKAGSALLKDQTKQNRLVLEDEILQLTNCHEFNIYIDTKGYCNGNNISGCSIYVKKGGEIILPSSCLDNRIIYEAGAIIRTTSVSTKSNDFHELTSLDFE